MTDPAESTPMAERETPDTVPGVPVLGLDPADLIGRERHVLYPRLYTWVVFLASLDIIMTWVVLHFGGSEANRFAASLLERWGLAGLIVLKFASIVAVVMISEFVGRRRHGAGWFLLVATIVISMAPLTLAFGLLVRFVFGPESGANFDGLIAD